MIYDDSICFSPDKAEQLNGKSFTLDKRVYLFAYYEPTEYKDTESFRSNFMTAVINLYGLFWDCCPFMRKILKSKNSILFYDWKRIQREYDKLSSTVSAWRSIFCHNNSDIFPLNAVNYVVAEAWTNEHCRSDLALCNLEESQWEILLNALMQMADEFIADLDKNLDALLGMLNTSRTEDIVNYWIGAIAESYLRNPDYLLNAMAGLYQYYLLQINTEPESGKSLRSQTINWLVAEFGVSYSSWYTKWLDHSECCEQSAIFKLLCNWPEQWAQRNGCDAEDCDEAPMPGSDLLRILASDVDRFAQSPFEDSAR